MSTPDGIFNPLAAAGLPVGFLPRVSTATIGSDMVREQLGPKAEIATETSTHMVRIRTALYEHKIDAAAFASSPDQALRIVEEGVRLVRQHVAHDMRLVTQEEFDLRSEDVRAIARDRDAWQQRALNAEAAAKGLRDQLADVIAEEGRTDEVTP